MTKLLENYNKIKKELSSARITFDEILILEELYWLEAEKEYGLNEKQLEKMAQMAWQGYLKFDGSVHYCFVAQAITNYWLYEKEENEITFEEFVNNFDRWVFCEYLCEVL